MKDTVKSQNTAKWRANVRRIAQWEPAIGAADHCTKSALQQHDICAWKTVPYTNKWIFYHFVLFAFLLCCYFGLVQSKYF